MTRRDPHRLLHELAAGVGRARGILAEHERGTLSCESALSSLRGVVDHMATTLGVRWPS